MVGLFVRLKLRLLRNGFRAGWQRAVGMIVGAVFALPAALAGFVILAAARGTGADPADQAAIAVLTFTGIFVGWACLPVLGFGSDETLDPSRLAPYPLRRRELMTGLLSASFVGVAPLATLLALTGSLVGFAPFGPGLVVVVVALVVELALAVTASRAVVTALARMLRSRRGRDVTLVLVAMVALLPQILRVWLLPSDGSGTTVDFTPAVRFLRWTPPGLAGHAMFDAGRGRFLFSVFEVALAAAAVVPLVWWWSRSLERTMTTAEATQSAGAHKKTANARGGASTDRGRPLFPRVATWLPLSRATAVAARELRYLGREPRRRVQLLSGFLVPVFALIPLIANNDLRAGRAVLGTTFFAFFLGLTCLNQLGVDGKALWVNVAAGNDPRADLLGKNLAALFWNVPLLVAAGFVLAALTGGWTWLPLAIVLCIGVLGVQLGVGNVMSARMPTPMPDSMTNPWAQNSGQGCVAGLASLLALAAEALLLLPIAIVVAIGLETWAPALVLAAPLALAWGALIWWIGLQSASRWLWWRLPELLDAVSPQKAV